jgi:outer membrane receptor protein involved in Fe transport
VPGVNLRLSGWQWDLDDLIEKRGVRNPDPNIPGERLQYQNVGGNLRSRGLEVEANYRDTSGWFGFAGVSYADVTRYDGAESSPNAPAWTGTLGASTPLVFSRFHLSSELGYVGRRHTRDPRLAAVETEAYVPWNFVIHAPDLNDFDVTVGVRNILGTREEIPAQSDYDRQVSQGPGLPAEGVKVFSVPGAGREIFARVGYRFR